MMEFLETGPRVTLGCNWPRPVRRSINLALREARFPPNEVSLKDLFDTAPVRLRELSCLRGSRSLASIPVRMSGQN